MNTQSPRRAPIPWPDALRVFLAVALQSFGGPAGQIAVMHRIIVDEKKWLSERRFLHALNYCMLLPGPEAMQLITYIGWMAHRTLGGLIAGALFVLPGFLSILALSILYALYQGAGPVEAIFFGIKPAVLAIVIQALIKIGKRVLANIAMFAIAGAAFIAIFFFDVPFPLIILTAGLIGLIGGRLAPHTFLVIKPRSAADSAHTELIDAAIDAGALPHIEPKLSRIILTLIVWLALWFAPIVILFALFGGDHIFSKQARFFSEVAVVTFGGAYSVLAYVAQEAVSNFGWLAPGEMLDGLGMAETTPGPLIQVVQFVGFMGAFRDPGALHPVLSGTLASILVTWVTFIPCFLWIFVGAPYVESLRRNQFLSAALSAITACVVGVILNLAVWFALHTLFTEVTERHFGPMRLHAPDWQSIRPAAAAIAIVAMILIFALKWGMIRTILFCALLGALAFRLFGPS